MRYRLANRLHVGVGVRIEQLEEEAEILGVALMRRRGQDQEMVGMSRSSSPKA